MPAVLLVEVPLFCTKPANQHNKWLVQTCGTRNACWLRGMQCTEGKALRFQVCTCPAKKKVVLLLLQAIAH